MIECKMDKIQGTESSSCADVGMNRRPRRWKRSRRNCYYRKRFNFTIHFKQRHITETVHRSNISHMHCHMSDVNLKCDKCIVPNLITSEMCEKNARARTTDWLTKSAREKERTRRWSGTSIINDHKPKIFGDVSLACGYALQSVLFLVLFFGSFWIIMNSAVVWKCV